jgi:bifunctional DNA-binding transcriptional regulator/antitoxin component of YhaV-PrlF toxin-antitoxin module
LTLKKVSYGTTKIQTLRRVALDPNLLRTLGLDIGDSVHIELDTEHEAVLITRAPAGISEDVIASAKTRGSRAKR